MARRRMSRVAVWTFRISSPPKVFGRETVREGVGAEAGDQGVSVYLPRLVEVEVPEPQPGEGEYQPPLELEDGGVGPVRLRPSGKPQDPPGDDQVDDPYHLPEVEEDDLAAPPRPPEPPPDEPPSELFRIHVRDVRPEHRRPQHLPAAG